MRMGCGDGETFCLRPYTGPTGEGLAETHPRPARRTQSVDNRHRDLIYFMTIGQCKR